jgi:hypothetical protein
MQNLHQCCGALGKIVVRQILKRYNFQRGGAAGAEQSPALVHLAAGAALAGIASAFRVRCDVRHGHHLDVSGLHDDVCAAVISLNRSIESGVSVSSEATIVPMSCRESSACGAAVIHESMSTGVKVVGYTLQTWVR